MVIQMQQTTCVWVWLSSGKLLVWKTKILQIRVQEWQLCVSSFEERLACAVSGHTYVHGKAGAWLGGKVRKNLSSALVKDSLADYSECGQCCRDCAVACCLTEDIELLSAFREGKVIIHSPGVEWGGWSGLGKVLRANISRKGHSG